MKQNQTEPVYPRIRDLPEDQQKPFDEWLDGQTRPLIQTDDVHDRFFPWDYAVWHDGWSKGLKVPVDD